MRKLQILLLFIFFIVSNSCKEKDDAGAVPSCSITNPADGSRYKVGQIVTIVADAYDTDGDLSEVRFYLGDFHLSIDREAPYRYAWETAGLDSGMYVIRAVAQDKEYNKTTAEISVQLYKTLNIKPVEFIDVQGGTFQMGCTSEQNDCYANENPVHEVTVDGFAMTKHEITNYHYAAFLNAIQANANGVADGVEYVDMLASTVQISYSDEGFESKPGYENFPVVEVSWSGAKAYCEHYGGRLPTEAEWEFAARGGVLARDTEFSGSDTLADVAWYIENAYSAAREVGTKFPNELGLHDMSGNVFEWCMDWYDESYYAVSEALNPQGPASGTYKVLRGGIYNGYEEFCRVAYRAHSYPTLTNTANGFRMIKPLDK